jgi:signal transduction histidine kinase
VLQALCDAQRVEQAVGNLISNALKYGAGKPVDVLIHQTDHSAQIEIRDHGRGVCPKDQKRIFMAFERAVSENEVSGLGIGLYVVDEIIRAHGGDVSMASELGNGSSFTIRLPL